MSLSVVVHAFLIVVWMAVLGQNIGKPISPRLTWIEFDPAPKLVIKKVDERTSKRVVQTIDGERTKTAPEDAFLGAQNQVVDSQTVSTKQLIALGKTNAKPSTKQEARSPRALSPVSQESAVLNKLGLAILPKAKAKAEAGNGDFIERLAPEWSQPSAAPSDYVKGLKESDRTALNTKEYMFYGYFQRIRQRLDLAWGGVLRDRISRLYRVGRQLASDMDHTTRLLVTLNKNGEVVRVQVMEESGTRDLDDAAISAFNKAGPFPNPPKGIVDINGLIQIRWDFVLKT